MLRRVEHLASSDRSTGIDHGVRGCELWSERRGWIKQEQVVCITNCLDDEMSLNVRLRQINDTQSLFQRTSPDLRRYHGVNHSAGYSTMQIELNGNNTMPYPFLLDLRPQRNGV